MIDISLYQRRLELAKQYIGHKIDGTLPLIGGNKTEPFVIDIGCIPQVAWEEAIKIYDQTGLLFWNSNVPNDVRQVTFEEYCEHFNLIIKQ